MIPRRVILVFGSLTCAGAPSVVPLGPKPETRTIGGFTIDSVPLHGALARFQAAFPRETGLCVYGFLRDTIIANLPGTYLVVERFGAMAFDSASADAVWYSADPEDRKARCASRHLVGIAHSHPLVSTPFDCTHSHADALLLDGDPRLLFSVLFCANGLGEWLWQDGRRMGFRWGVLP
ncbi:MAG TPA: hypothetical protein VNL18_15560 [Gemmatimonadales bacterium]|nr:hypothetical protein [Gemmatimonadales bacterium]